MDIMDIFGHFYLNHLKNSPLWGYFLGQKHKSAICDRTPPTYTSNLVYMCAGGFRGPESSNRIEISRSIQECLHI